MTWSCGCPYDAPPWHSVVQCRTGRPPVDTTPQSTKLPTGCITPAVTVPVEQLDDAGRAHLPGAALTLLAAARPHVSASRLTWAYGWGRQKVIVGQGEDGAPIRAYVACPVESLVLRVPGVLWVGWAWRHAHRDAVTGRAAPGDATWKPVKGQVIDASAPGGVRLVTQTEAGRILK